MWVFTCFYIHYLHSCWCIWVGFVVMFFSGRRFPCCVFKALLLVFRGVFYFSCSGRLYHDSCCSGLFVVFERNLCLCVVRIWEGLCIQKIVCLQITTNPFLTAWCGKCADEEVIQADFVLLRRTYLLLETALPQSTVRGAREYFFHTNFNCFKTSCFHHLVAILRSYRCT